MTYILRSLLLIAACVLPALAHAQAPETVVYYHTDAVGSVRAITNNEGQAIANYDYLPFGEPWGTPSVQDPRRFAGKEKDAETGFDYFGARYYASSNGRFTTVDPVLDQQKALLDPQLWNRYTYVRNNPFRYVDPDGRNPWDLVDFISLAVSASEVWRDPTDGWNWASLAGDALGAALPIIPAPGTVIRGARAVEALADAGVSGTRLLPFKDAERLTEVNKTLDRIDAGTLLRKDGRVFQNREGLLPKKKDKDYYKEYTVQTPGAADRGRRRVVRGKNGETYYTDDHYDHFIQIDPTLYGLEP